MLTDSTLCVCFSSWHSCYLNSLLQSLYLTPEFRQLLFDLSESELGLDAYHAHELAEAEAKAALERLSDEERAAAKAAAALQATPVSEERIEEFTAMGMDRTNVIRTLRKFPKDSEKEAAMDYLFTHDFSTDPPESADSAASSKPKPRLYKVGQGNHLQHSRPSCDAALIDETGYSPSLSLCCVVDLL